MQTDVMPSHMCWSGKLKLLVLRALRLAPYLLGTEILVTLVFALVPADSVLLSVALWDKTQHIAVFALLALTASVAYPTKRRLGYASLLALGAIIEIMQAGLTMTRSGEFLDLLADGIGIVLGSFLYWLLRPYLSGATEPSRASQPPRDETD